MEANPARRAARIKEAVDALRDARHHVYELYCMAEQGSIDEQCWRELFEQLDQQIYGITKEA